MSTSNVEHPPLLIEWSPSQVRIYDPSTGTSVLGASISACMVAGANGRRAVVAVSQRSAFIRAMFVPNVAQQELAPILAINLGPHMPLDVKDCVIGFRLGSKVGEKGRLAIVGAMRAHSLRAIRDESTAAGLQLRAVLPIAFTSWLAARKRSLATCAVVRTNDDLLSVDIIDKGELQYSRTVPLPENQAGIDQQVARTFSIAETTPGPTLSYGSSNLNSEYVDERDPLEFLSDLKTIERDLFTFELTEESAARVLRRNIWVTARAVIAATAAVAAGAYAYYARFYSTGTSKAESIQAQKALDKAKSAKATEDARNEKALESRDILDMAFKPSQTYSDVITVLSAKASKNSWFTGATLQRGRPILIRGTATNGKDVANYVQLLAINPRFRAVKLVSASKSVYGKVPVVQFVVSGYAMGLLPLPDKETKI